MNIKKLTITPIIRGAKGITIDAPSTERAQKLITERLTTCYENEKPARLKLPKFLKGFVNPKTRVIGKLRSYM
ncbi:hypothetical protein IJ472_02325 [bacterium]|nr:hypothetical protein [bacterium]